MRIDQGWLSPAVRCPCPNFNARPSGEIIDSIVIHNISLPPDTYGTGHVQSFFNNTLDCSAHPYFLSIQDLQVSAHCFVERDGRISQFVNFDQRAWHAGESELRGRTNCNDFSIGIELEGSDHVAYSQAQYEALAALISCLQAAYPAISKERIVGHSDIAPGRKTDPGDAFDWNALHSRLNVQHTND